MAVTVYCDPHDLGLFGLGQAAFASWPVEDIKLVIQGASETVDSYLRDRFDLPLEAVGMDIRRATAIIAAYDLISVKGFHPSEPAADNIRKRYEDILSWLNGVKGGSILPNLPASAGAGVGSASSNGAKVISSTSRGYNARGMGLVWTPRYGRFTGD